MAALCRGTKVDQHSLLNRRGEVIYKLVQFSDSVHKKCERAMNKFNPRKLKLSKWTACEPVNREKHFLVIQLLCDDQGAPIQVELQAVHSARSELLDWQALRDSRRWKMGWS